MFWSIEPDNRSDSAVTTVYKWAGMGFSTVEFRRYFPDVKTISQFDPGF